MSLSSQQYADLSKDAYVNWEIGTRSPTNREFDSIDGVRYELLEHYRDGSNGYAGTIYQRMDTGDIVRLTIRSKLYNHYTVAIAAPDHIAILDEADAVVQPLRRKPHRKQCYLVPMLSGESLRIGEDVTVSFGEDRYRGPQRARFGNQVRIGIHAPREVPVHREEICWRIRYEVHDRPGMAA